METFGEHDRIKNDESLPGLAPVSLRFLIDRSWWKATFGCAGRFAHRCILGAVLLTVANVSMVVGNDVVQRQLVGLQRVSEASISDFVMILVTCLFVLVFGMTTSLWAASVWLVRLTTFARAYKLHGHGCTAAQFDAAGSDIASRKAYLAKFWLLSTVYLLVPVVPFIALVTMRVFTRPEWMINGEFLVPLPPGFSVPVVDAAATWVGGALLLATMACSFAAIAFAAVSPRSPFQTANKCFQECLRNPRPVLAAALLVGLLNVILTSPLGLIAMIADPSLPERNLWFGIATQVWLGVTSTVVWTASVAPFCMITSSQGIMSNNDGQ